MASLRKEKDRGRTGWRLQFRQDGKRRSLWLGPISKRSADAVSRHIEELARADAANTRPDADTARWADGLDGRMRATLERWRLVDAMAKRNDDSDRFLGAFCDRYIEGRTDIDAGTVTNFKQARRLLVEYFAADKLLQTITAADADRWRRWLLARVVKRDAEGNPIKTMAPATVSKHIKRTKQMFAEAVRDRLLPESPFADQKGGCEANKDRHHFVDRETTATVLNACDDDHDWRMIFGLARFGGLRCPSEVTRMRWSDVQWDRNRLRIDSTKTGLRFCPIFPELRPILQAAAEKRENDLVMNRRLIAGYSIDSNLATQLQRIVERAGIKPWPKTFINLRSTRRTELQERFPSHVVDAWMGHSTKTAETHYLQVTADHWAAGATMAIEKDTANTGDVAGGVAGGVASAAQDQSARDLAHEKTRKTLGFAGSGMLPTSGEVTPTGLEPVLPP